MPQSEGFPRFAAFRYTEVRQQEIYCGGNRMHLTEIQLRHPSEDRRKGE